MIVVSKCFTGECCRYDGRSKPDPEIAALVEAGEAVAVCPEQLGGLPTLRVPSELTGSGERVLIGLERAVTKDGRDVTREYVSGAYDALRLAKEKGARVLSIVNVRGAPPAGRARNTTGAIRGASSPATE